MTLLLRFLIGGAFVSLFSVIGDSFKPKSFAGIFGGAPSISLAGLILISLNDGNTDAVVQSRSMIFGALAMVVYGFSCGFVVKKIRIPPWLSTGILWLEWFITAFVLQKVFAL